MGLSTALTILAVCLAIGIDCRRPVKRDMTKKPRILYGTSAKSQEFPFMAMQLKTVAKDLQPAVPKYVQLMCGASLISDNVLLTAAHCVIAENCYGCANYLYGPRHYAAYIGGYRLNGWDEEQIAVDSVIVHDDYNFRHENDIALVILTESLELSNDVAIISLPNISDVATLYKDGAPVTITGWGLTETGHISDILMKLDQIVTPASNCAKWYSDSHGDFLHPGMMCTGAQPMKGHAYHGDYGGPLFTKYNNQWVQLGLVGRGPVTVSETSYDVNTNISYYKEWIDQQLSSLTDALETVDVSSTPQTFNVTNPRSYYYKVWHLYAPDHEYVSVEILWGHLESGKVFTRKDVLELYDGSNDQNKIIIQLSGVMSPANYTSSNNSMTVILKCSEKTEKTVSRGVIFNVSGSDTSSTDNGPKCAPGFFACENREQCIIASHRCSNRAECFDGSAEHFQQCVFQIGPTRYPTKPTTPPPPPPTTPKKPVSSSTLARSNVIVSFMAVFTIFNLYSFTG